MPRRRQKLSRSKSRTVWLAWLAWGVIGSIFVFEDTQGGTGWLALIFTSPFWVMFAAWPFICLWLKDLSRRDSSMVEIDDDIPVPGSVESCRIVQKDGVRYAELESFMKVFGPCSQTFAGETLEGGTELFIKVDDVRFLARGNKALSNWIETVDSIGTP